MQIKKKYKWINKSQLESVKFQNKLLHNQKKANYHIEMIDNDSNFIENYWNNFPSYNIYPLNSEEENKEYVRRSDSENIILNDQDLSKHVNSCRVNDISKPKDWSSQLNFKSHISTRNLNNDLTWVEKLKQKLPYVPMKNSFQLINKDRKRVSHNWSSSNIKASNHSSFCGVLKLESDSEKHGLYSPSKKINKVDTSNIIVINGKPISDQKEKEIKLDEQLRNKFKLRSRGTKLFESHQEMLDKIFTMATQISKNNQMKSFNILSMNNQDNSLNIPSLKSRNWIKRVQTSNVYTWRDMVTQSKLHSMFIT